MKIHTLTQASEIWLQYKLGLQQYIFKYVKSEDLAKELVQQVLMKVYGNCCNGRDIKNTKSRIQRARKMLQEGMKSVA